MSPSGVDPTMHIYESGRGALDLNDGPRGAVVIDFGGADRKKEATVKITQLQPS